MEERGLIVYLKNFSGMSLLVITANAFFCILSIIQSEFVKTLMFIPAYIFTYFEPWRFITSPFSSNSVISSLILLPSYWSTSTVLEKRFGSVKYCFFFISNCILSEVLSLLLYYIFSINQTIPFTILLSQIMTEIVIISKKNPESPINFLCCPGKIKSEFYPYVFLLIGFFFGKYFEIISGFLIGQLSNFHIDLKISLSNLRRNTIETLESSLSCACFHAIPKFVPIAEAIEEELPFTFVHADNPPPRSQPPRNYERVRVS